MNTSGILLSLLALAAFSYFIGRKKSLAVATRVARGGNNLHSLPSYYGYLVAVWAGIPALTLFVIWTIGLHPDYYQLDLGTLTA